MEPIVEQIAQWIETAIDGLQDPDGTLTLRAVRPKLLEWEVSNYLHGDVIIEASGSVDPQETGEGAKRAKTNESRTEVSWWLLHGVIKKLPDNTAADTMLARMSETVRRLMLAGNVATAGNSGGHACDNLAMHIDCPDWAYGIIDGAVVAEVRVEVRYQTALADGYAAPG